jgi:hypothetical protein
MNLTKRLKQLEATVKEQEATILHLRTANSVLSAKLVQKRRRKPKPMQKPSVQMKVAKILLNRRITTVARGLRTRDERGVFEGPARG